jgi:hypothetical protein
MPSAVPVSFANDARFLGEMLNTDFDYNSCRVPWRLGTDYVVSGDAAVKGRLAKMNTWIRQKTGDKPDNIVDGYSLAGDPWLKAGPNDCFTAGFGVSAIVDAANQKWVDDIWGTPGRRPDRGLLRRHHPADRDDRDVRQLVDTLTRRFP